MTEEIASSLNLTMSHSVGILCLVAIREGESGVWYLPDGALQMFSKRILGLRALGWGGERKKGMTDVLHRVEP